MEAARGKRIKNAFHAGNQDMERTRRCRRRQGRFSEGVGRTRLHCALAPSSRGRRIHRNERYTLMKCRMRDIYRYTLTYTARERRLCCEEKHAKTP